MLWDIWPYNAPFLNKAFSSTSSSTYSIRQQGHLVITVFCQINAPGAEAENEPLSLSNINQIRQVHPMNTLRLSGKKLIEIVLVVPEIYSQAVQTSTRKNNMLKEANFVENNTSELKLGSFDNAWYKECHGTNSVAEPQIFVEWRPCFFIYQDNIWQTVLWRVVMMRSSVYGWC